MMYVYDVMMSCQWAMNPIPRIDFGQGSPTTNTWAGSCRGPKRGPNCVNFKPVCDDSVESAWSGVVPTDADAGSSEVQGECSGDWTAGTIVDEVLIPQDLAPGAYVVGWRWDCEVHVLYGIVWYTYITCSHVIPIFHVRYR